MTFPFTHFSRKAAAPAGVAFLSRSSIINMLSIEGNFGYGSGWTGSNFTYTGNQPYDRGYAAWRGSTPESMPAAFLSQIVAAGFDTMRIVIDPGPLNYGLRTSTATFNALMAKIQAAIALNTAAGLRTLVDLSCRPSSSVQAAGAGLTDDEVLAAAPAGASWLNYLAMVKAVAVYLAANNSPANVALEMFNEPPSGHAWASHAPAMFAQARLGAPGFTIFVAGDGYASVSGLTALTAANFDANTIFVVHCYSPYQFAFVAQPGAPSSMQYVATLEFPPVASNQSSRVSAATAAINADGSLTSAQKTATISTVTSALSAYYTNGQSPPVLRDAAWITAQLNPASAWASAHGVAGSRCIIGEFGANGSSAYNYNGSAGASDASVTNFYQAILTWASANGFNWGVFSGRDAPTFGNGLTIAPGGATPQFNDARLLALGLNPLSPGSTLLGTATRVGKDGWEFHAELPPGSHTLYAEITNPDNSKVQTARQAALVISGANPAGAVTFTTAQSNATIQAAVTAGGAGKTFIFSSGTYRDISITPLANQVFIGKGGVTFTGSITIAGWTLSGGYYQAAGFPADNYAPGGAGDVGPRGVIALIPNDLYWNGVSYLRVATKAEVGAGKFYVDGAHVVYVTDNPTGVTTTAGHQSEAFFGGSDPVSAFPPVNGVVIYGITFKEYATPENRGALQFGATSSLTLINCKAYWNHCCGVSCGTVAVYGGEYSSNGQLGVLSYGVTDTPLSRTRVTGAIMNFNNNQGFSTGYGAGGVKTLWMTLALVEYSTFQSNQGTGVWWDTACGGTISRNTVKSGVQYGVQIEENQGNTITVSSNLLDQNNQDGNWGGLSGTNIFATASANIIYQNNLIISQNGAAAMGLNEDSRSNNVINCNVSGNTVICYGTSGGANGGASMGESNPPIFAGSNFWDNNTWVAINAGRIVWAWGGSVFNASNPGAQPIDSHGTYVYLADPSTYLASLNPTLSIAVHEQLTPGGSAVLNATGFAMLTGTFTGKSAATIRVYRD